MPKGELRIDRRRQHVTLRKVYFWPLQKTKSFASTDIADTFIERSETTDRHGNKTGRTIFYPFIRLKSGKQEPLNASRAFTREEAETIVDAIEALSTRGPKYGASPRESAPASDHSFTVDMKAKTESRRNRNFCRFLGGMVVASSLYMMGHLSAELFGKREAIVLSSTPRCDHVWRISKDHSETKTSDCTTMPTPDKAPSTARLVVYRGAQLDVVLKDEKGETVRGSVFVTGAEAERAKETGNVIVVFRPKHRVPVQTWNGYSLHVIIGFMFLAGLAFFFAEEIRQWRQKRRPIK